MLQRLKELCERWDLPLGPFREPEDIDKEMDQEIQVLGPLFAFKLVDFLTSLSDEKFSHMDVLCWFAMKYVFAYPDAMKSAILNSLRADGPPCLIGLLGDLGRLEDRKDPTIVPVLLKNVQFWRSSIDTQRAILSALGYLGGDMAIIFVKNLDANNLAEEVREELEGAYHNLKITAHPLS